MLRCNTILGNSGPGLYLRINVAFQFPGQEKEPWGQVICGVQPPHWACVSRNFNKLTKSNWLTICSLNMLLIMANLHFAEPQKKCSCLFLCLMSWCQNIFWLFEGPDRSFVVAADNSRHNGSDLGKQDFPHWSTNGPVITKPHKTPLSIWHLCCIIFSVVQQN